MVLHTHISEIVLHFHMRIYREWVLSKSDMLMGNENALVIVLHICRFLKLDL